MGKKIILAAILVFILVSVPLTIFLVNQRQELRMKAAPSTNLSLQPQSKTLEVGETLKVNITIDTQTSQAISTSLSLKYDPEILEAISITSGSFLQNPIEIRKNIDQTIGNIDFSFYTLTPQKGSGILASVELQAKSGGVSQIEFNPTTSIGSSEQGANNEITKINGVYTVTTETSLPSNIANNLPATDSSALETPTLENSAIASTQKTSILQPTVVPSPTPTLGAGGALLTYNSVTPTPSPLPQVASTTPTPTTSYVSYTTPTPTTTEVLPVSGLLENTLLFSFGGLIILSLGIFFLL